MHDSFKSATPEKSKCTHTYTYTFEHGADIGKAAHLYDLFLSFPREQKRHDRPSPTPRTHSHSSHSHTFYPGLWFFKNQTKEWVSHASVLSPTHTHMCPHIDRKNARGAEEHIFRVLQFFTLHIRVCKSQANTYMYVLHMWNFMLRRKISFGGAILNASNQPALANDWRSYLFMQAHSEGLLNHN